MALDFEVQRFTRRCFQTERDLAPGETFYSALFDEAGGVVRRDFCEDAWDGPPEDAISSWKSQVPAPTSTKVNWAPNDVMMHYFEKLEDQPDKADFRYVLTLLMIRRRILQFDADAVTDDEAGEAATSSDDTQPETMKVYFPRKDTTHAVLVADPAPERIDQIQEELARLFCSTGA